MFHLFRLLSGALVRCFYPRQDLLLENLALRQQLTALKRRHPEPKLGLHAFTGFVHERSLACSPFVRCAVLCFGVDTAWYDYRMLADILVAVGLVLHLAIAVVLVRKYLRTRDVGLVWLGVAVVIWPLVSRLLEHGESVLIDRLVKGQSVGYFPFSLVERGQITIGGLFTSLNLLQQLVGIGLLLVAALYLYKTKDNSNLQAAAQ